MDASIIALAAFAIIGIAFIIVSAVRNRPNPDDGVNVEAESHDPVLAGPVTITRQVTYAGQRDPESSLAIARYETTATPRIVKFIMARTRSYMSFSGHYVIYEHYRADGSLEFDRLVYPEALLGGGIYVKERLRFYDKDSKPVGEKYFRQDGSLGLETENASGLFRQLRKDGKTPRFEQYATPESGTRSCSYRKDGKTILEETDTAGVTRVHFDRAGNPVDLTFTREHVKQGFGVGPAAPLHYYYSDLYQRADGTLDYKQVWYKRWDKATEMAVDTLGEVIFYDATGTRPTVEYKLEPLPADRPMNVVEVKLYDPVQDGKFTLADTKSPPHDLKGIAFQGFRNNIWGTYDDESRDI